MESLEKNSFVHTQEDSHINLNLSAENAEITPSLHPKNEKSNNLALPSIQGAQGFDQAVFTLRNDPDAEPILFSNPKEASGVSNREDDFFKAQLTAIFEPSNTSEDLLKAVQAYQPLSKDMQVIIANKSKFWKIRRYKNAVYFGELHNGQRHGKGIMLYQYMSVYEGDWENNTKHGIGMERSSQNTVYQGEYKNGKPEGRGTFVWASGETYEGEWKSGDKHGNGVWKGTKGESYVGAWVMGRQEGYGVFTWRNGEKYEGEFLNFLKHGHGKEHFGNGEFYVGTYHNGKPNGYGEYYWPDGRQYKGNFKNGLRHGKGVWRMGLEEADNYDGEWANDKKCGYGVFRWKEGNRYEGNFFDDMREGYGEMYWEDGSVYKGMWRRGTMHGQGNLLAEGDAPLQGLFENGVFMGNLDTLETEENKKISPREFAMPVPTIEARDSFKKLVPERVPYLHRGRDTSYNLEGGNSSFSIDKKRESPPRTATQLPSINSTKRPPRHAKSRSQVEAPDKNKQRSAEPTMRGYSNRGNDDYLCSRCLGNQTVIKGSFMFTIANATSRNNRSFLQEQTSSTRRNRDKLYCRKCGAEANKSPLPQEKMPVVKLEAKLLTNKELARWNVSKHKYGLEQRKLENLNDPMVCTKIRGFLTPHVWYPTQTAKIQKGRSDYGDQVKIFCAVNGKR